MMVTGSLLPAPLMAVIEMVYLASSSTPNIVYCLVVPLVSVIILLPSPEQPLIEKVYDMM